MPHGRVLVLGCIALTTTVYAQADSKRWISSRPDGHAPIGVIADHMHSAGEVMLSYRYMHMEMDGLRDGSTALTPDQVLLRFPVTPINMPMDMHMFGVMYAPIDRVTFMGMLPIVSQDMRHRTRTGAQFTTAASGIGDLSLSAMIKLFDADRQRVHLNAGLSLPTGSIDKRDVTPASQGQKTRLPYPMQLGSGTVDLRPGVTYLGQTDFWSWGGQVLSALPLGDNDDGYHMGNSGSITAWGSRRWNHWWSNSLRLTGSAWGDVHGRDAALNPAMVPN